jgi:hypothetical protein
MKRITLFILSAFLYSMPVTFSQNASLKEQSIFIYNFTREIEWPMDYRLGDFIIQVYGSERLFNELKAYTNSKKVITQTIVIKKVDKFEQIDKCNILFVGNEKAPELAGLSSKLNNNKILIITDKMEGILNGAGIGMVMRNGRLNYEISTDNIIKMGLKYSQNLVDMALDIPIARINK